MAQMLIRVNEKMDNLLQEIEHTYNLNYLSRLSIQITEEVYKQWRIKMKLRNKKTGEIYDKINIHVSPWKIGTRGWTSFYYDSVDKFKEEWEDYESKEPKLDGEVREIVRHWANLHGYNCLSVDFVKRGSERIFVVASPDTAKRIEFLGAYVADDFDAGRYTTDELCGEEE